MQTDKQGIEQLTLAGAQEAVDHWIKTIGVRYFNVLTNLGILTEEVGELARILVRIHGEQSFKKGEEASEEQIAEELADVLWVILCLANQTGVNLSDAFRKSMAKKSLRDGRRHHENSKL